MDQGAISNMKAYYLRHTFKQLVKETDGQDKQSIREFWKNYHIMKAIDFKAAGNEVTENCMKGIWKKLWPEAFTDSLISDDNIVHVPAIINNIVKLANEGRMHDVNVEDVEELIESHGEDLTIEELQELAEQHPQNEPEDPTAEPAAPEKILTTEFLSNSITKIEEIMDQFTENDPDWGAQH